MKKIIIFFCFLLMANINWANENPFCKKKINPYKKPLPVLYRSLLKWLDNQISTNNNSRLNILIESFKKSDKTEICSWNYFIFTDFIYYFERIEDLSQVDTTRNETKEKILFIRNKYYRSWLDNLKYGELTGHIEWEKKFLVGEGLNEFIKRKSDRFYRYQLPSYLLNRSPRGDRLHPKKMARLDVYNILLAKTPFNAIMTKKAMELVADQETASQVNCIIDRVKRYNCSENLFQIAQKCTSYDVRKLTAILGVLASQRMALVRDMKGWMEQNLKVFEFNRQFSVLKNSSYLHFLIGTRGEICGGNNLVPKSVKAKKIGAKAYHFWSTAFLSMELSRRGYEKQTIMKEATRIGKKYKSMIRVPGLFFNIALRNSPTAGTVGEYKQVLFEQKLGALWGYEYFYEQNDLYLLNP